jgi:dTDP-4-dehydrorhamnose 3,5-epimerase
VLFHGTSLPGAYLVELEKIEDERGHNARTWCRREFEDMGLTAHVEQANTIYNARKGTLRGMHYQVPPKAESKLFRVIRGAVHDVIIDLRPGSPTYGEWESFRLSASEPRLLYVPECFAQGFQTL